MKLVRHLLKEHFGTRDGLLTMNGVPVPEILKEFGTPLFLYDPNICRKKLAALSDALPMAQVYYSVKANPSPALIRTLLDEGCGLEIASGGELALALRCGCPASDIIFAGPGKTARELSAALDAGIGGLHAESALEIRRLATLAAERQQSVSVALRVNPSEIITGGAMVMGGKAAAFGIDEELLSEALDLILQDRWLTFRGLHFYSGSQIMDSETLVSLYSHYLKIASQVGQYCGEPVRLLDFGGGFGIPYFEHDSELDLGLLKESFAGVHAEASALPGIENPEIIIEPGRYLVGDSGVYVSRVIDKKISKGTEFLILDGGMNHNIGAAGHLGQVMRRNFPIAVANRMDDEPVKKYTIAGPLCTPLDTLGRNVLLPETDVGDILAFFQSGAYIRSASPLQFLGHPEPAELFVENGRPRVIRQGGTIDYLFRGTDLEDSPGT